MENLWKPVEIGTRKTAGNVFMAPVAGYSDTAYRALCAELGCILSYTEMVSSEALTRGHQKTLTLLARDPSEKTYAIQLFGSNPDTMARAAEEVSHFSPLCIDINCGCPVPKITKNGAGSALMKTPERIGAIVSSMTKATDIPITVKIRLGWDEKSVNYVECAKIAEDEGASAVTLHARTKTQGYSGVADWEHIAHLVKSVSIPVFGSGDVFSPSDTRSMIEKTGCAGVMAARGMTGNPFFFREAKALLEGINPPEKTETDLIDAVKRHLELSVRYLGEKTACVEFRKRLCAYTKGTRGGAELRGEAVKASTVSDYLDLIAKWRIMIQ